MKIENARIGDFEADFNGMMIHGTVAGVEFSEYLTIKEGKAVVERVDSNIKLNQQDDLEKAFGADWKDENNSADADLFDALEEAAQEAFKSLYIKSYDAAIVEFVSDFDPKADKESGSPWCLTHIDWCDATTVAEIQDFAKKQAEEHAPEIAGALANDFANNDGNKRVVIVNDGQYDIYDLQNFYDIFGRVDRAIAHDWDAIQSAYLEADDMMEFYEFETLIDKYEPIKSLDDLYIKMLENHPSVMDHYKNSWSSDLPNFGGEEPDDTSSVWSWDEKRLIIGEFDGDLAIITREEYAARQN